LLLRWLIDAYLALQFDGLFGVLFAFALADRCPPLPTLTHCVPGCVDVVVGPTTTATSTTATETTQTFTTNTVGQLIQRHHGTLDDTADLIEGQISAANARASTMEV